MIFFLTLAFACGAATNVGDFVVPALAVVVRSLSWRRRFRLPTYALLLPAISACVLVASAFGVSIVRGATPAAAFDMLAGDFLFLRIPCAMLLLLVFVHNNRDELVDFLGRVSIVNYVVHFMERAQDVLAEAMRETSYTADALEAAMPADRGRGPISALRRLSRRIDTLMVFLVIYVERVTTVIEARGVLPPMRRWRDYGGGAEIVVDCFVCGAYLVWIWGPDVVRQMGRAGGLAG
ncbi:hypothetical protein [Afifella marina]|uniref:Uncharacterized protein n=1 Tax=Afifella marina DSM 2698 TaxID=1120955 RepID=A0A1G5P6G8_AFIMA|nr:hypothetical protein [Afifella marina]MBK1625112.1 hypothetical protein [Afifella marina DSM 2698]MBK1627016.1 hypothetical protein [Afifella marina]MBK5919353.1 hypothetical protein [Afifella marina]RAI19580.1 hypothetical protein CH311_12295 [Afifella marina DSM 2698]SCZ44661.1 hypothetical protein SAMN03080610_03257 [Afifella marina DSM 2698]